MPITARDVHEHLRSLGPWVAWDRGTCDGFKHGDPEAEVTGIAVTWQALQSTLEEVHARGHNLVITHEPTFYSHMDDDDTMRATPPARLKAEFLDRTGMVVYRCHDLWDIYPEVGVVDSWSAFLGLGEPIARERYYNLHSVPETPAWELVGRIARCVAPLGQQAVLFVGSQWQMVHRLAVGTGAITNVRRMVEMGADIVLATDDGTTLWRDGAWMVDLGIPLMLVNHTTAEIPGIRNLAAHLAQRFPGVPCEFLGPTCGYQILATERARDTAIRMRRDDLESLPPVVMPEGYAHRPMATDEVRAYLEVMNGSNYSGEADQAWFDRTFASDPEYDPAHLQIIWKGDRPVAAAAAWHERIDDERWGMVHWVGVSNVERGSGLGKAVTLAALHRLRQRGFNRAMLDTHAWRLAAVAAYMRLGFRPWPTDRAPQEVWDRVLADLAAWRRWGAPRPPWRGDD
jgi:putative NIF3 family GTP cyclohydrolase 1 type 2/RimJ/RimL family protein N-acetyltransferase